MKPSTMNRQRKAVAAAFRKMANGVENKAAYASTVEYYRSSKQEWAKSLA
jgi:hypothetical protein